MAVIIRHFVGADFEDSPWRAVLAAVCFQGVSLVLIHFFVREHEMGWTEAFGLRNNWKRAVLFGVLATLLFLPIGWGLQWSSIELMSHLNVEPNQQEAVRALEHVEGWADRLAIAGVAVVLAPIAEEILFRGILYSFVRRLGYPGLALWSTSLLFALIHWNVMTFVPLFVLAVVLVLLYEKTNNLLAPIAMHSFFNALNFLWFYFGDWLKQFLPSHQ